MATDIGAARLRARNTPLARVAELGWPAPAWGAIGVTALFIGITCWWLTQDRSIPIFDAGLHLALVVAVHHELSVGNLGTALTQTAPYPPFAYLVGSLGIAIGGVGVAQPIIAENLVFVTLLALGCYKVGRLAFGPAAGMLAVVFALGSPLITDQFHVFMTDAPETAMVAVSIWLIIATKGFSKLYICAVAGLAVGLGMLTKEPFPIFVIGVVLVTAARGGWRSWRGLMLFGAVALVIALPWYISELSVIKGIGNEATAPSSAFPTPAGPAPKGIAPPRLSSENLEWYLWNLDNHQLGLPLLIFAAVGFLWTAASLVPRRPRRPRATGGARRGSAASSRAGAAARKPDKRLPVASSIRGKPRAGGRSDRGVAAFRGGHAVSPLALELTVGAFLAYLLLTESYFHDTRYSMPLLLYPAVFGASWLVRLPRRWRSVAVAVLIVVVGVNTLKSDFSVGSPYEIELPGASPTDLELPGYLMLYPGGFLVQGPERDGNALATFEALRRNGVRVVTWNPEQGQEPDFSNGGLAAFAEIAQLESAPGSALVLNRSVATLVHGKIEPHEPPPCVTLDDGTGIWIRLGSTTAPGSQDYCPLPRPHYYGPKQA
jgi:4-amino-4-deoxy-L-arabinose transferase-like glycosyltransferase